MCDLGEKKMKYPAWQEIPKSEQFTNMFGCHEMEMAAERIVKALKKHKRWDAELNFWVLNDGAGEYAQIGLFMLAAYHWIMEVETDGTFIMSPAFGNKILKLLPVKAWERPLHN